MKGKAKNAEEKNTKEQIMDAAIDLFSQKGYDAVSMRDIARAVSIRESSIYNHFKGKDDIMDTITGFFIAELSKFDPSEVPMEAMLEKFGPEGYMDAAGRAYMQYIRGPRMEKIWRLISIELYRNKRVRDFFKTTMIGVPLRSWEETFQKMIDLGYIREYDVQQLAREFFYYCLYLYFEYFFLNYEESGYEAFVDSVMDNLSAHIKFMFEKIKVPEAA